MHKEPAEACSEAEKEDFLDNKQASEDMFRHLNIEIKPGKSFIDFAELDPFIKKNSFKTLGT